MTERADRRKSHRPPDAWIGRAEASRAQMMHKTSAAGKLFRAHGAVSCKATPLRELSFIQEPCIGRTISVFA